MNRSFFRVLAHVSHLRFFGSVGCYEDISAKQENFLRDQKSTKNTALELSNRINNECRGLSIVCGGYFFDVAVCGATADLEMVALGVEHRVAILVGRTTPESFCSCSN